MAVGAAGGPGDRGLSTPTQETAQIRAEIERVTYRNDENGWTVIRARDFGNDQIFTATGHFPPIHSGEQFELIGTWGKHPQYGAQFKIERMVPIRPNTRAAIERYLASGLIKGIGPKTAAAIVAKFGIETLDILDANPRRLVEVPSVGAKKAEAIIESWSEQRGVADVMMFLNAHGVSPVFATRIYKAYGAEAIKVVSADPYRLAIDIQGIGFLSADKIARSMGIAADSDERLRAAALHTLQQGEERGHCYVTSAQLENLLVGVLQLPPERFASRLAGTLTHLNDCGAVISQKVAGPDGETITAHFPADLMVAEHSVAQCLSRLLASPLKVDHGRIDAWLERYAEASGTSLSDEQMAAVRNAATHQVFILTGGPGVGKTTTANAIIRLLKAMGRSVALAAPTGRAAQRLTEVSATPAKTIHRLLEWVPHLRGFARDENNPLPASTVIIDEASMLDIRLAEALLRSVDPKAQLILIGDVDQLPSVGPGNVLRDLIESKRVPFVRLSRIFRQAAASRIIRSAHAINDGETPEFDDEAGSDCRFIDAASGDEIKACLKELITRTIPRTYGFDPVRDVQILTPMNRGEMGTQTLNQELQALLNPPRPGANAGSGSGAGGPAASPAPSAREWKRGGLVLRPGDKVIQVVNNYDLGVFNGDIGFVQDCKVDGDSLLVAYGDRVVAYKDDDALDLRLAYAITIHKSQGSEFPVVIIPSTMQHYVMLQRNLVYTALTRARKLAIFIGARKALAFAVGNATGMSRQTSLAERLRQLVPHEFH